MPIPSLPTELIEQILSHLQRRDLAICARAHRRFLPLVRPKLYTSLDMMLKSRNSLTHSSSLLAKTLEVSPHISQLVTSLSYIGWHKSPTLSGRDVQVVDCTVLLLLLQQCPRLEELSVRGVALWLDDLRLVPDLVSLTVKESRVSWFGEPNPTCLPRNIQQFVYDAHEEVKREDQALKVFGSFASLTHLDILHPSLPHLDQLIKSLNVVGPGLKSLRLSLQDWVTPDRPMTPSTFSLSAFVKLAQLRINLDCLYPVMSASSVLPHLPPNLAYFELVFPHSRHYSGHDSSNVVDLLCKTVKTTLNTLVLRVAADMIFESDKQRLARVCSTRGVAFRLITSEVYDETVDQVEGQNVKEQVWHTASDGEAELRWRDFSR